MNSIHILERRESSIKPRQLNAIQKYNTDKWEMDKLRRSLEENIGRDFGQHEF